MTIKEALKKYHKIEIELLLAHILKKTKEFLYIHSDYELSKKQTSALLKLIKLRLKDQPISYLLGYKDFYGLRFKVNPNVLIPRPETEQVIDLLLAHFKSTSRNSLKILDIGTGSGCIAITLAVKAKEFGVKASITGSDISVKALLVAKKNSKTHQAGVKFIKSDLLQNVSVNFDILIANLPYGWYGVKNRFSTVKNGLKYEPKIALFTEDKGLKEIHRLLKQIAELKIKPKLIYIEFDPRQKSELIKLIKKYLPKARVKFYQDFNNLWRYLVIKPLLSTPIYSVRNKVIVWQSDKTHS